VTVTAEAQRGEGRRGRAPGAAGQQDPRSGAWLVPFAAAAPLMLWYSRGGPTVLYNVVGLVAVAALAVGLRWHRPQRRRPWLLIGAGLALTALADAVWLGYDLLGADGAPFPSPADALYLASYPCIAVGLVLLGRAGTRVRSAHLDAVVVTAAVALATWFGILAPAYTGEVSIAVLTAYAYPAGSLVLLGAVVYAVVSGGTGTSSSDLLLAGIALNLLVDALWTVDLLDDTYVTGGLLDAGWLVAYLLIGAAALHPSMSRLPGRDPGLALVLSRQRFVVLVAAALTLPAVDLVLDPPPSELGKALVVAVGLAVAWRLYTIVSTVADDAVRDPLTGLPNAAWFAEALGEEIRDLEDRGGEVSVVLCGVDQLRVVNDALGLAAGDGVLIALGRRLETLERGRTRVARLRGDEFALLTSARTDGIGDRIWAHLAEPIPLEGALSHVTVSIGVAVTSDAGTDPLDLIRESETALHKAKRHGRQSIHHFGEELRAEAVERHQMEQDLPHALAGDELFCVYQPEVELLTGRLFGFEALVRWEHPTRGLYPPDRFIPTIENLGLSSTLFNHVLATALADQAEWARALGFHPAVAVNLSPLQLNDPDLRDQVVAAAERFATPLSSLWIEVTESAVADTSDLVAALCELRALGVLLAIDDFGTGFATLARLSDFEWDLIKIDSSFTAGLGQGGPAERTVAATIAMAKILGVQTLAEGVETADQARRLTDLGCDYAQGYHYARPLRAWDAIRSVSNDGFWHMGPAEPATRSIQGPRPKPLGTFSTPARGLQ
jgi:diguanylate cyclase (GGDEF)-like protein